MSHFIATHYMLLFLMPIALGIYIHWRRAFVSSDGSGSEFQWIILFEGAAIFVALMLGILLLA